MIRSLKCTFRGIRGWIQDQMDHSELSPALHPVRLGSSVEGRAIERISLGTGERSVLVFACIHGNEVGTHKTAIELLNWFQTQTELQAQLTLHVIPVLNPDGFAQAREQPTYGSGGIIGRFNVHRIDLNRHFPTTSWQSNAGWNRGTNYQEVHEVFAGNHPGTEPEYQTLAQAVHDLHPTLAIALHNVGRDVMPNQLPVAEQAAHTFAAEASFTFFSQEAWKALAQTGTACEWFEQQGIPYVEIELPSRWGSCWSLVERAFKALLNHVVRR